MVGYPESLTDPSYEGQILVLTYPLIGSYGVPARNSAFASAALPAFFESSRIHVAALVVASYSGQARDFSHHLADSELGIWLKEQGIPAIYGVDTRAVTKKIREKGVMLGRLLAKKKVLSSSEVKETRSAVIQSSGIVGSSSAHPQASTRSWRREFIEVPFADPNNQNLVARVSVSTPKLYTPKEFRSDVTPPASMMHPSGRPLRVLAVDVGMKYNQIRCFVLRGVELKTVPWDYDFLSPTEGPFDGLFISNGPGDPTMVTETIDRIRAAMEKKSFPIFGICLGHQLLALASGASTTKLKYGNRGQNIPCTDLLSGRCYITSQNHGYAVDATSLKETWKEFFVNANDGSNEGILNTELPFFSVQFHPESTPGPRDTEFLFDVFIKNVSDSAKAGKLVALKMPGGTIEENTARNPRVDVRKVLILGSGGLSIGQAGEFDYSGSQCIKALKEEGIYTVVSHFTILPRSEGAGIERKIALLSRSSIPTLPPPRLRPGTLLLLPRPKLPKETKSRQNLSPTRFTSCQ